MKLLLGSMFLMSILRLFSFSNHISTYQKMQRNMEQDTTRVTNYKPEKITIDPFMVLAVTDTANRTEDIGQLLGKSYGELFTYIGRHKLKAGKTMAFYYSSQLPFVFDAAVEVNQLPADLTGRIKGKKIKGGDAIVVHYQGPYNQIGTAYAAITKWLKENDKKAFEQPYEVYLNDPGTVKDPQLLRTDVYQRIQ